MVASVGANFLIWATSPVSATIVVNAASLSYCETRVFCFLGEGCTMFVVLFCFCWKSTGCGDGCVEVMCVERK